MIKKILLILLLAFYANLSSQQLRVAYPELKTESTSDFGKDVVVLNNEPIGVMHGLQDSKGTIFVAINDTQSTHNLGLIIRKSSDRGKTWTTENGINHRDVYGNIKLLRNTRDSIYCIFQIGSGIYSWKIDTETIDTFNIQGYRTFDAEITSSESIYLFVDSINTDHLMVYGSTNGGKDWPTRRLVSERSAYVKVVKSKSSDTMFVNYYGPVLLDTSQSIIRSVRYYELAPGNVFYSGFKNLALEQTPKREFLSVASKGNVWFIYSILENGKEFLCGTRSQNNGATYSGRTIIAPQERNVQNRFDIKPKFDDQGFNLIYFSGNSDSNSLGNIVSSNVLLYDSLFTNYGKINDSSGVKSEAKYKPIIIPLISDSTFGYIWVGNTSQGKKVFWDSEIITGIDNEKDIEIDYLSLQQNYPNPFNSRTVIKYSIPEEGNVRITLYDILGRARGYLINEIHKTGDYSYNFDAEKIVLESGVYFYQIIFTNLEGKRTSAKSKKLIYLK
jgi:hypothetical protein